MKRNFILSMLAAIAMLVLFSTCSAESAGSGEQVAEEQQQATIEQQQATAEEAGQSAGRAVQAQLEEAPPTLADMQNAFRQVAEVVTPVVVQINIVQVVEQQVPQFSNPFEFFFGPRGEQPQQPQQREFRQPGLGSGVIVRQEGSTVYVLTNNHVVGQADEISIVLNDQSTFKGKLVGTDPRMDLALVSFESKRQLPVAVMGDSDAVEVGDWVLAVGNPLGLESTVTAGIISAVGRTEGPASNISDFMQTDAAINPGNSGGALVNIQGQVIGINTWIASTTGTYIGFGFAIPSNNARRVIDDLIEEGRVAYGWLGVSIRDPLAATAEDLGISGVSGGLVANIYLGSPADEAGIQAGDYITAVDGTEVRGTRHLTQMVGSLKAGSRVEFRLLRQGGERSVTAQISERLTEEQLADQVRNIWPGMVAISSEDAPQLQIDEGRVIVAVAYQGTPAGVAGFRQGDVIRAINGEEVTGMSEYYQAINQEARSLEFTILRQGREVTIGMAK
ncbi:MAG: Do family serine endopeptidase [Spirochaetales bacterium]|nr:Do family serine endopeptidase [Spirochaetales bacterium]